MSVFVLPSSREGLPGALCEAMAAGLPCVVTDVGSMGHHVRLSGAGFIVSTDAESITDGIENALGVRWMDYSESARKYAERYFSADAIARTYLDFVTQPEEINEHA
jgi:glycosyltransferase involved in cell wall biosynthesis